MSILLILISFSALLLCCDQWVLLKTVFKDIQPLWVEKTVYKYAEVC